jgi:peroxiredoxin
VGYTAPDFTLKDLNGQSVTLSSLRGKNVVFLDFWATWCGPCKAELPHVQNLHNTYKDRGLKILAIDLSEAAGVVQGFINDNHYSFAVLLDLTGNVTQNQYGVKGIPTMFIIDTQGIVRKVRIGYLPGVEKELEDAIIPLLPH